MLSAISFPGLGITMDPSPLAFTVLGKDIYWYGIIIAMGFLLAYIYMDRRAPRFGLNGDQVLDMLFWAVPIGIVCARIYYCVFYWDGYRDNPISCLYIWEGGLAIYGGVLGGILGLFLCHKVKKLPFWTELDLAAYGVLLGQICGRWGNFMNREAHGSETASFLRMGLTDPDGIVRYYHPTFLYESLWNLVGFVLLHFYAKKRKFDGEIFLCYLFWYGLGRVWIEGLRTDSLYLFGTGIRVSQLLALLCVLGAGTALAVIRLRKKPDPARLYVNRKAAEAAAEAERSASSDESSQ